MLVKQITFEEILPIWHEHLWPCRESAIETHSAMTWPFSSKIKHDMHIFNYTPSFWGVFIDSKIVGVNSGHSTTDIEYRSRGLWVDPTYRKLGIAQMLLLMTEHTARNSGATMIWTMPRKTALVAYTRSGFRTIGDFFGTETAEANIYAFKPLLSEDNQLK